MKFLTSALLLVALSVASVRADDVVTVHPPSVVTPGPKPTTNDWADEVRIITDL